MSELWQLPTSWVWTKIGEVADVVGGGTPPTNNPGNFDGDIPWITPADLSGYEEKHIQGGARTITHEGYEASGAKWLPKGSVLFSSRAPIGYVAIASVAVTTNQGFKSFVLPSGIEPDYLYYWLRSAKRYAEELASGTTFKEISGAKAALIPLPLAPASEQTRIVAKLEELLSDLDAGVVELKTAQKKLQQYRQSLLKAAVEGALTADWREAQRQQGTPGAQLLARILTERRARWEAKQLAKFKEQGKAPPKDWQRKYPEPVKPHPTDLRALPKGWVWASVDQLAELITSGSRGWADYYADEGATFIRSQNINKDLLDLSDIAYVSPPPSAEGARTLVRMHDLLLTITGANVGKAALVDVELDEAYVSQHVALIRPIDNSLSSYLHLYLTAQAGGRGALDKKAYGAGKPGLNLEQVGALVVPIPSIHETDALMNAVAAQLNASSAQEGMLTLCLKRLTAQRQNVLRAAFAGQLIPQGPNDEPANVILDRIREERAARTGKSKAHKTQYAEA